MKLDYVLETVFGPLEGYLWHNFNPNKLPFSLVLIGVVKINRIEYQCRYQLYGETGSDWKTIDGHALDLKRTDKKEATYNFKMREKFEQVVAPLVAAYVTSEMIDAAREENRQKEIEKCKEEIEVKKREIKELEEKLRQLTPAS